MPGIPSKDASFVWGTPRNYALTIEKANHPEMEETLSKITVDTVIEAEGKILSSEYVKLNGMEMYPDTISIDSIIFH